MQEIIAKARELAQSILTSDTFSRLRASEDSVIKDDPARQLTERYEQLSLNLRAKEEAMQPISADEKRELLKLREEVAANPKLVSLRETQGAYYALMDAVNGAIQTTLDAGFKTGQDGAADEPGEAAEPPQGSRIILP